MLSTTTQTATSTPNVLRLRGDQQTKYKQMLEDVARNGVRLAAYSVLTAVGGPTGSSRIETS